MKSYTDLEQSKKLAEFLPLESADMFYTSLNSDYPWVWIDKHLMEVDDIPCWSLAALLEILDFPLITQEKKQNKLEFCLLYYNNYEYIEITETNPVDACYEMILKLHELNLL